MRATKGFIALFLALLLVWPSATVFAEETDPSFVKEGSYSYSSNENRNIQCRDQYIYREDCFMRSSRLGCCHLNELSATAALASAGYYGDGDMAYYEVDPNNNGRNIQTLLEDMGFEDVETNRYYNVEKLENSSAVCVGHRTVEAYGKTYTLLAIIPRSAMYKREWVGNLTVGTGDIHEGFKEARDEVLRYVKQYMEAHGIEGDLKVWTAGHSRGSAVANLLGGFFAGGGIDYFGDSVRITPEDVYCYGFANPATIKDGASKAEALSVGGARGGEYPDDTPGEAYVYTGGGTIDVEDSVYDGIRNHPQPYDFITMLPPKSWGFTLYGKTLSSDEEGKVSAEQMLTELAEINDYAYRAFTEGGDYRNFRRAIFDVEELQMVEDSSVDKGSMAQFMSERVAALLYHAKSNEEYVEGGGQAALKPIGGLYGMLLPMFSAEAGSTELDTGALVKPGVLLFLSYAAERLMEEGTAADEEEAVTHAVLDMLAYLTGEEIDSEITVDEFMTKLLTFVFFEVEGEEYIQKETPLAKTVPAALAGVIPEDYQADVVFILALLIPGADPGNPPSLEECMDNYLKVCVLGSDPECAAGELSARECRELLYNLAAGVVPGLYAAVDGDWDSPFSALAAPIADMLKTFETEKGEVNFPTLGQAADYALSQALDELLQDYVDRSAGIYGQAYHDAVAGHLQDLKGHITMARRLAAYLFLYEEGESYSTASLLRNACTFIDNMGIIPPAHFNEINLAWARAVRKADADDCQHYIKHVEGEPATCTEDGTQEHWRYHEKEGDRYFLKRTLSGEIDKAEIPLPKTGHDWGPWKRVKEPTETEPGREERICRNDPSHVESREIPPTGEKADKKSKEDRAKGKPGQRHPLTGDQQDLLAWIALLSASFLTLAGLRRRSARKPGPGTHR